jgi:hypothetical protein
MWKKERENNLNESERSRMASGGRKIRTIDGGYY